MAPPDFIRTILLFAVLSACSCETLTSGLTPTNQYVYKYDGFASTELHTQVQRQSSDVAVRCDVTLQVQNKWEVLAKFSNFSVADFNGDLPCFGSKPKPNSYTEDFNGSDQLQKVFKFYPNNKKKIMTVPKDEEMWVTNMRKSIVQHFQIPENLDNYFDVVEDTLLGTCQSTYMVLPYDREIFGFGKSRYWRLLKSIDFQNCPNPVVLPHNLMQQSSRTVDVFKIPYLKSRVSSGEYVFRETSGEVVLESFSGNGNLLVRPDDESDDMKLITNQNLHLTSLNKIVTPFRMPSEVKDITTWNYEVLTPTEDSVHQQLDEGNNTPFTMESLAISMNITESLQKQFQNNILSLLESSALEIRKDSSKLSEISSKTLDENVLQKLQRITELLKGLSFERVKEIFEKIQVKGISQSALQRSLLIDACASSGSIGAYKQLLSLYLKGNLSLAKVSSIFATLTSNPISPSAVNQLMEYSFTLPLNKSSPIVPTILANIANIIRDVCLLQQDSMNGLDGRVTCGMNEINTFVQLLNNQIQKSKSSPLNAMLIESLSQMGWYETIPLLRMIFDNRNGYSNSAKIAALNGLARELHLPNDYSGATLKIEILNSVIFDSSKPTILRQIAVEKLMSWRISTSSWWRSLAELTVTENAELASFVYFSIERMASNRDPEFIPESILASYVLSLTKKYCSSLYQYPSSYTWSDYSHNNQFGSSAGYSFIPGTLNDLKIFIQENFEGVPDSFFELDVQLKESLKSLWQDSQIDVGKSTFVLSLVKLFGHLKFLLPASQNLVKDVFGSEASFLQAFQTDGFSLEETKFLNREHKEAFIPLEIGIPCVVKIDSPLLLNTEGHVKLRNPQMGEPTFKNIWKSTNVEIPFIFNAKLMAQTTSKLSVILPWSLDAITATTTSSKSVNLPIRGTVGTEIVQEYTSVHRFYYDVKPLGSGKIAVFDGFNIPYTSIERQWPQENQNRFKSFKVVDFASFKESPEVKLEFPQERIGISGYSMWKATLPNPFTFDDKITYLRQPLKLFELLSRPTNKIWKSGLLVDVDNSPSTEFRLTHLLDFYNSTTDEKVKNINDVFDQRNIVTEAKSFTYGGHPRRKRSERPSPDQENNSKMDHGRGTTWIVAVELTSKGNLSHSVRAQMSFYVSLDKKEVHNWDWNPTTKEIDVAFMWGTDNPHLDEKVPGGYSLFCLGGNMVTEIIKSIHDLRSRLNRHAVGKIFNFYQFANDSVSYDTGCPNAHDGTSNVLETLVIMKKERTEIASLYLDSISTRDPLEPFCHTDIPIVYDKFRSLGYLPQEAKSDLSRRFFQLVDPYLIGNQYSRVTRNYLRKNPDLAHDDYTFFFISGERKLNSEGWDLKYESTSEYAVAENFKLPSILGNFELNLESTHGKNTKIDEAPIVLEGDEFEALARKAIEEENELKDSAPKKVKVCTISSDKVTTFNGTSFKNDIKGCYVTASINLLSQMRIPGKWFNNHYPKYQIFLRNYERKELGMQTRIFDVLAKADTYSHYVWIDLSQSLGLSINGSPFKMVEDSVDVYNFNNTHLYTIYNTTKNYPKQSFLVEFARNPMVLEVSEGEVRMVLPDYYKDDIGGICGKTDSKYANSLLGPQTCFYNDTKFYTDSWTAPLFDHPHNCPIERIYDIQKIVKDYQKSCDRLENWEMRWYPGNDLLSTSESPHGSLASCTFRENVCFDETEQKCIAKCQLNYQNKKDRILSRMSQFERYLVFGKERNPDFRIVHPQWSPKIRSGNVVNNLKISTDGFKLDESLIATTGEENEFDVNIDNKISDFKIRPRCHWKFSNGSTVASINDCVKNGLHGIIITKNHHISLYPLKGTRRSTGSNDFLGPHILYIVEKSKILPSLRGEIQNKIENMENLEVLIDSEEDLDKYQVPSSLNILNANNSSASHQPESQVIGDGRKTVEIAIFCDSHLYDKFGRSLKPDPERYPVSIVSYIYTLRNALELLYHQTELGQYWIRIKLVRIVILTGNRPSTRGGNIGDYLNEFCDYQTGQNPGGDSNERHWDHALMLSGLDLWTLNNGQKSSSVIGLAWKGGMCNSRFSCSINEGGSFLSLYIVAHELGHNLGMDHDGQRESQRCNPSSHIMSPSVGPGKTTWSPCSVNVLRELSRISSCLDDGVPKNPAKPVEFKDLPGQKIPTNLQCEMAYGQGARPSSGSAICSYLFCNGRGAHAALVGSSCGSGRICIAGSCRPETEWRKALV